MDKIKALIAQLGASKELTDAIVEEFRTYDVRVHDKYKKEFAGKLEKAKQVCTEAVAAEKAALARKVAVFLESKVNSIQQASARQRAIEESEAKSLLKRVKALTEGIQLGDDGAVRDLQAAQKKSERLEKALAAIKEERDQAIKQANSATKIATTALRNVNVLEEQMKQLKAPAAVKESKTAPAKAAAPAKPTTAQAPAAKPAPRRLDESRIVPGDTKSTRTSPASAQVPSKSAGAAPAGDPNDPIGQIAAQLD